MEISSIKTGILSSTLLGDPQYSSNNIVFASDKGNITLCPSTGQVTFPEGMTVDEASKRFWDGFVRSFGGTPIKDKIFAVWRDNGDSEQTVAAFTERANAEEYAKQTGDRYVGAFISEIPLNPPLPLPIGKRRYVVMINGDQIVRVEAAGDKESLEPSFLGDWCDSKDGSISDGLAELVVEATNEEEARRLVLLQRDELMKAGKWKYKGDKLN